jgi:type I restriction enzyme, R subunit
VNISFAATMPQFRSVRLISSPLLHPWAAATRTYIEAHGIDPKIPPIEILDPNFAAEVSKKKGDRAKAADMENALRHHISISFERDPAKYKSLSERLEGILAAHRED